MTGDRWRLVAAREVSVKVRDKTFIGSTLFTLVLVMAWIALSAFLGGRASTWDVAVVDDAGAALVASAEQAARAAGSEDELTVKEAGSADEAEDWLREETVDAALLPTGTGDTRWELVGGTEVDRDLGALLGQAVRDRVLAENAAAAGTTPQQLLSGVVPGERVLETAALDPGLRFGVGFAFAFLFYMTALVFGLAIAQSVVEEKQSRVVEILATAIPLRQLLTGKVVGNSVLAIAQVVLLVGVGLVGLRVTGQSEALGPVLEAGAWFVVFFLLGFAALACIWAVAGSVATRQEDLQATTMPVQTVVLAALLVGVLGEGTLLTVGSFVPLVSSVAMPVRMLAEDLPLWQPVASAGLVVLTAVLLVRLGARLYEGSLLRTDRRTRLREALDRSSR